MTGKDGENFEKSGKKEAAAHPGQDRRLPGAATHSGPWRASARSRVGIRKNPAPGSLSTGSLADRTPLLLKRGDGSMYSQAHVRATGGRHKPENRSERSRP